MCLISLIVLFAFFLAGWREIGLHGGLSFVLVWVFGAIAGATAQARKLNGELD